MGCDRSLAAVDELDRLADLRKPAADERERLLAVVQRWLISVPSIRDWRVEEDGY